MGNDDVVNELQKQIAVVGQNIGVRLGLALGAELIRRGLLTNEKFGYLGTEFGLTEVQAFQRTHAAFPAWDLGDWDFQVGGHPVFRAGDNRQT